MLSFNEKAQQQPGPTVCTAPLVFMHIISLDVHVLHQTSKTSSVKTSIFNIFNNSNIATFFLVFQEKVLREYASTNIRFAEPSSTGGKPKPMYAADALTVKISYDELPTRSFPPLLILPLSRVWKIWPAVGQSHSLTKDHFCNTSREMDPPSLIAPLLLSIFHFSHWSERPDHMKAIQRRLLWEIHHRLDLSLPFFSDQLKGVEMHANS